jgi:hypothetical protein
MALRPACIEVVGVIVGGPVSQSRFLNRGRDGCDWFGFLVGRACDDGRRCRWLVQESRLRFRLLLLRPFDGLKTLGGFSTREYCCLTKGLLTGLS